MPTPNHLDFVCASRFTATNNRIINKGIKPGNSSAAWDADDNWNPRKVHKAYAKPPTKLAKNNFALNKLKRYLNHQIGSNKLAHDPTVVVRDAASEGDHELAEHMLRLFKVDSGQPNAGDEP